MVPCQRSCSCCSCPSDRGVQSSTAPAKFRSDCATESRTTPNCGSLWRRAEFVSPEQERMQESMKKYTKRNGLIFSNAMAVRQCPFGKSKWTTITIKHRQRTERRTSHPVQSTQAKRMKRPVQGRPVSIIAKLAHIVVVYVRLECVQQEQQHNLNQPTNQPPTAIVILASSEWRLRLRCCLSFCE